MLLFHNIRYLQFIIVNLYYFRNTNLAPLNINNGIQGEQIQAFFVMNGDVCADFPLNEMLDMHFNSHRHQSLYQLNQPVLNTIIVTETTRQQSVPYGMYILDVILTYL